MTRGVWLAVVLALAGAPGAARAEAGWPSAEPLVVAPDTDAGALPPSVSAETVADGRWRCTFRFHPAGAARSVTLAGSFNNWDKSGMPLTGPDADGNWTATVELPANVHLYKFVVDDERWFDDPRNPDNEADGQGGKNSRLRLGYVAHLTTSPATVGDGQIEARALEHDPDRPRYFQPLGGGQALVRLRTLAHDVERVWVVVEGGTKRELTAVFEDATFTLWEGVAGIFDETPSSTTPPTTPTPAQPPPTSEPAVRTRHYTFLLQDGALSAAAPTVYGGATSLKSHVFTTPEWARHAVWYQIMLDRFRNGDPANDRPPVRPWTSEWFTPSPWEKEKEAKGETFYKWYVFDRQYGGDLAGLEEKLPYLKALGVNAIYLTPIFKAESYHKYNAESYLHVDDHYGTLGDYDRVARVEDHTDPKTWQWTETDRRFLAFLKVAHAQGFKVIIDGVFNHVGTAHPAFQDVQENGPKSRYADWFNVTSWKPFKYEGWFGHDALPVFKKGPKGFASNSVKQYIFNVTRRWLDPDGDGDPSDGIDGWRLDVPNEVPAPFWVEWRALVKSINPDAYITGEIWERAEQWLDGDHFDAVMNYEFARTAVAWVFDRNWQISPSEADRRLRELRLAYPLPATLVLQNLVNSHDTDRLASMAFNPDRGFDQGNRVQDNGPNYNNTRPSPAAYERARLAALLQMTYVGAPMIWNGDEVGMFGGDDPNCRKPMLWEDLQPYDDPEHNFVLKEQLAHYQRIIALRNAHPALRTGTMQTLLTDDRANVWVFLRRDDNEQLIVALNSSDRAADVVIPLPPNTPSAWAGVYNCDGRVTAEERKLTLHVPAVNGIVLHAATPR